MCKTRKYFTYKHICIGISLIIGIVGRPAATNASQDWCIGWANPTHGEVDVAMRGSNLCLIWGPPVERLVGRLDVRPSIAHHGPAEAAPLRAGVVWDLGSEFINNHAPRPSGFGGGGPHGFGAYNRVANTHPIAPSLPRYEVHRCVGSTYRRDLRVYADGIAVVSGNELWFPLQVIAEAMDRSRSTFLGPALP